jgi:orotate phosphoribosyltransferase
MSTGVQRKNRDWLRERILRSGIRLHEAVGRGDETFPCVVECRDMLLRQPDLSMISQEIWDRIRGYRLDAIAGATLSADPLIAGVTFAALSDGRALQAAIVRKEAKRYGLQKLVEGPALSRGARVGVVDDLLNRGLTARRCMSAIATHGAKVVVVAVVVDYGRVGVRRSLREDGVATESLFSMSDLGLAPRLPQRTGTLRTRQAMHVAQLRGPSSPVTLRPSPGGEVVVVGDGRGATAVDIGEKLSVRWRYETRGNGAELIAACGDRVALVERHASRSRLRTLDLAAGGPLWHRDMPGRVTAIDTADDQRLIVGAAGGTMALAWPDGETLWETTGSTAALAAGDGVCCSVCERGELAVRSLTNGELIARRRVSAGDRCHISAAGRRFLVSLSRRELAAFDEQAVLQWLCTLPEGDIRSVSSPCRDAYAVATTGGELWTLDAQTGSPIARYRGRSDSLAMSLDTRGTVWSVAASGALEASEAL